VDLGQAEQGGSFQHLYQTGVERRVQIMGATSEATPDIAEGPIGSAILEGQQTQMRQKVRDIDGRFAHRRIIQVQESQPLGPDHHLVVIEIPMDG
jgi:hypothetical protein